MGKPTTYSSPLSDDEVAAIAPHLDELFASIGVLDTFDLLASIAGEKRGSYMFIRIVDETDIIRRAYTESGVSPSTIAPDESDPVEEVLTKLDVPYVRVDDTLENDLPYFERDDEVVWLDSRKRSYFVSNYEEDFERIRRAEEEGEERHRVLGDFLGYPESAVNDYVSDHDTPAWKQNYCRVRAAYETGHHSHVFKFGHQVGYSPAATVDAHKEALEIARERRALAHEFGDDFNTNRFSDQFDRFDLQVTDDPSLGFFLCCASLARRFWERLPSWFSSEKT